MERIMRHALSVAVACLICAHGCGSSGAHRDASGRGRVVVTIRWPRTREIPPSTQSIRLVATVEEPADGPEVGNLVVPRPSEQTSSTAVLENLPSVKCRIAGTAFATTDGTGQALASGTADVAVPENGSVAATLDLVAVPAVTVTPASVNLGPGGTAQFSATVSGITDHSVTWNASAGSISISGLFTAPLAFAGDVTITAASVAQPLVKATAVAHVVDAGGGGGGIKIMPQDNPALPGTLFLNTGETRQLTAVKLVDGSAVQAQWTATAGSIDANTGAYTALSQPGFAVITAASSQGTATLTVGVGFHFGHYAGSNTGVVIGNDNTTCDGTPGQRRAIPAGTWKADVLPGTQPGTLRFVVTRDAQPDTVDRSLTVPAFTKTFDLTIVSNPADPNHLLADNRFGANDGYTMRVQWLNGTELSAEFQQFPKGQLEAVCTSKDPPQNRIFFDVSAGLNSGLDLILDFNSSP